MGGRPLFMERELGEIGPVGRWRKEKRREKSHVRRTFKKFIKVGRNSCAKTLPRLRPEIPRNSTKFHKISRNVTKSNGTLG
jgi:hypothetical protein